MMQKRFRMSIGKVATKRNRFQLAPNATHAEALPLLEKQALIDESLRGVPIKQIEYYEQSGPNGVTYLVTKGWPQLFALFEFIDNQFPTWDAAGKRQWEQYQQG